MKFFIFTCLLAVALAKHKMEHDSSSEENTRNINELESAEVPTEKIQPTVEKTTYLQQLNKINRFYRNLNFLQYIQASHQHQIVMNPWEQIKTRAYAFVPTVNRDQLSTSEESTEVPTKKTGLTEEEKNYQRIWNKVNQYYQKFTLLQHLKTIPPYQTTMKPWNQIKINAYQIIPTLRHL